MKLEHVSNGMQAKLASIFLSSLICLPLGSHAEQNLQSRFHAALERASSTTNVEIEFLDTLSIKDPSALKVLKVNSAVFSRTSRYSYLASGQKYRATSRLVFGSETNLVSGRESAFDGKSYRSYDPDHRRMTINSMSEPVEGMDSMNLLIMPFKFLQPSFDGHSMRFLNFTAITSGQVAKDFALPEGQVTNGAFEITLPGASIRNKPTTWKITIDETGVDFAPKLIEHIFPASGSEVAMRLLNYTNLGAYQFPARVEWAEIRLPLTIPPTVNSTGVLTLVSARIPERVSDSVFELKSEEEQADSIWDWEHGFVKVAPSYAPTNACVPYTGVKIYDESADAAKQIADALELAKSERKRVLLEFGANWSDPCHRLHSFFETNPDVAKELEKHYVVVMVDVNKDHNAEIEMKYGHPIHLGLPAMAVLDSDGQELTTEDQAELVGVDGYDLKKTVAFMRKWALEKNE